MGFFGPTGSRTGTGYAGTEEDGFGTVMMIGLFLQNIHCIWFLFLFCFDGAFAGSYPDIMEVYLSRQEWATS